MAEDSEWFRTAAQLEDDGWRRDGTVWTRPRSHSPRPEATRPAQAAMDLDGSDTRSLPLARAEDRMVPLYEAKMIHQMDHRWATYEANGSSSRDVSSDEKADPTFEPTARYWVPEAEVAQRLRSKGWNRSWLLGWRKITRATDERTLISAIFPKGAAGDSLPLALSQSEPSLVASLQGSMTSIVLDYVERQKLGGTNLTFQFLFQLPILTRDELRYILDPASVMGADYPSETFRVLKQKEERLYGDYRTERLVLEAWDRLSADWGAVGLGEGA